MANRSLLSVVAIASSLMLTAVLAACSPSAEPQSAKTTPTPPSANELACEQWVTNFNSFNAEAETVSDDDWFAGVGAQMFSTIAEQEAAAAAIAEDAPLKTALENMATTDREIAAALSQGVDAPEPVGSDADIYDACFALGIQTEPRWGDGSLPEFYIAGDGSSPALDPEEVSEGALQAVREAYYDCFPAVAAGVTIIDFIRNSPAVSGGVTTQMYTPSDDNERSGFVTIGAGATVLQFLTVLRGNGEYTIEPNNDETKNALAASQCVQH
jgi:hypothetical protein